MTYITDEKTIKKPECNSNSNNNYANNNEKQHESEDDEKKTLTFIITRSTDKPTFIRVVYIIFTKNYIILCLAHK